MTMTDERDEVPSPSTQAYRFSEIDRLRAEVERLKGKNRELLELSICLATADENGESEDRKRVARKFSEALPKANARVAALEAAVEAAQWALIKVLKFVPRPFQTGWSDAVQQSIDTARAALDDSEPFTTGNEPVAPPIGAGKITKSGVLEDPAVAEIRQELDEVEEFLSGLDYLAKRGK
jgi:hypothetical protein